MNEVCQYTSSATSKLHGPSSSTDTYCPDFTELLRHEGLPKTLKSLDLIQESNTALYPDTVSWSPYHSTLSLELARATRHLEHVALTWQADAEIFFCEQVPSYWHGASLNSPAMAPWENLVTLSLTCSAFTPGSASWRKMQHEILRSACSAVRLMPRLTMLTIWNCGGGSAAFFEFGVNGPENYVPEVLWMSSWHSHFSPQDETFQGWRDLARERDLGGREPRVRVSLLYLSPEELASPWGLLRLHGSESLLHGLSTFQVSRRSKETETARLHR